MLAHWRFTGDGSDASRLRQLVLGTLDYCLSIRLESGNFPSSEADDEDYMPSDKLVQVSDSETNTHEIDQTKRWHELTQLPHSAHLLFVPCLLSSVLLLRR